MNVTEESAYKGIAVMHSIVKQIEVMRPWTPSIQQVDDEIIALLRRQTRPLTADEFIDALVSGRDAIRDRLAALVKAGALIRTTRRAGSKTLPAFYELAPDLNAIKTRADAEQRILVMLRKTDKPLLMQDFVDALNRPYQYVTSVVRGLKREGLVIEHKRYGVAGGTLDSLYEAA